MICPSCQSVVEMAADACPNCGWKFNKGGGKAGPSLVRPAVRPKLPCEVELAVTVDRTGSSGPFEVGIPKTYETIVGQLAAKTRSVRCWVASHGDLDCNEPFVLHTDGGSPEQAIADIKKIVYGGGGDPPEHHLDAIESLLNKVPWTANPARARGAILAFTTADSKPARSGISARDLGAEIRRRGLLLYLVCEPTPTLHDLVQAAQGLEFQITNSPDPAELQRIAAQLAASIVATVASGGTIPMTVPIGK
jgi:hypothetical protein